MRLDRGFLEKVLPEAQVLHGAITDKYLKCVVDSRAVDSNSLFFALKGAKVDGHFFIDQALKKAAGVVVSFENKDVVEVIISSLKKEILVIAVSDTLAALVALGTAWRAQFSYPVAAITGSLGKTTTKQLTAHMLACAGKKYLVAEGNLNTLIGVAMMISLMDESYDGALFEVGISLPGEMEKIIEMLNPTTGLITCIAHAHTQGLGSVEGIAIEKRKLFKKFGSDNIGIIYGDQPLLSAVSYPYPIIRFGMKTTNQIQARKITEYGDSLSFVLKIYNKKYHLTGLRNHQGLIKNILASTALAHQLGVEDAVIVQAIKTLPVCGQRFELLPLKKYGGVVIDDCYNASPESVKAALLAFQSIKSSGKKIAVLGDMLELGENSAFWHRQIGRFLRRVTTLNQLILVGEHVSWIEKTAPLGITIEKVSSWQDAVLKLSATLEDDAVVLVKGSHGMQLHNLVSEFVDRQVQIEHYGNKNSAQTSSGTRSS